MALSHRVIKFYKVTFDENWKLVSVTDQVFTYQCKKAGTIQVGYEAPQGTVITALLSCPEGGKAIIHRDVIHTRAIVKYVKGDSLTSK